MSEGRTLVYPQALACGARPITLPGGRNVLCASVILPFRLSSGEPIKPADWYEAVTMHGGPAAMPDSMAPLPGAEVMLLGALPPVVEESREAFLRCGQAIRNFVLYRDPEAPDTPPATGTEAAVWHEQDNPVGRGGPDDDRIPLIVDSEHPQTPLWLGPTPFDHAVRMRRIGIPDESSGTGWPPDADPSALHDAHDAFWARSFHAGDPLTLTGLSNKDVDTTLPLYRVAMASARLPDGRWVSETARIQCVTLIPAADVAAVIWRAAINTGDDILGEKVGALVVALEDIDGPVRDEQDLAEIAVDRWLDPVHAVDDRPLLPAAMAASVQLPFGPLPSDDPIAQRHAAAESWMREEMGAQDVNPFAPEQAAIADQAQQSITEDAPPDANAVGEMATAALAASKRRHAEAGFKEIDPEAPREPIERGAKLDAEINERLARPYRAPHEVTIAAQIAANASQSMDAKGVLEKLAQARVQNINAPLFWPALNEQEATRFGDEIVNRLSESDFDRHIDISGAIIGTGPGASAATGEASSGTIISGRNLDGLLAEETVWRGVEFENCELRDASLSGAHIENCVFRDCTIERTNLSRTKLTDNQFKNCEIRDLNAREPVWMNCQFEKCLLEKVTLSEPAMRDMDFRDGAWREVQMDQGLLVGVEWRGTEMNVVTFALTHAPHSRFERLSMFKVWAMSKGFPGSVFQEVEAKGCGFLSVCHFDESTFERTRFVETGFTNAVFKDAQFAPGCHFDGCDLSGAVFDNTLLRDTRFLSCSMATSLWGNGTDATGAWFFESALRGVNFNDTRLANAVFADADVDGAVFEPDKTINADFRGTSRSTG